MRGFGTAGRIIFHQLTHNFGTASTFSGTAATDLRNLVGTAATVSGTATTGRAKLWAPFRFAVFRNSVVAIPAATMSVYRPRLHLSVW